MSVKAIHIFTVSILISSRVDPKLISHTHPTWYELETLCSVEGKEGQRSLYSAIIIQGNVPLRMYEFTAACQPAVKVLRITVQSVISYLS